MTNRVARIAQAACLALLMSGVAGAGFAVEADTAAKTDDCLSGPKGAAPQGERWYYRVERNTKRHCWYTRAGSSRSVATRTPAAEPVQAADDAPAPSLQPSVANARAEASLAAFPPPPAVVTPPSQAPAKSVAEPQPRSLGDRLSDHPDAGQLAQASSADVAPTQQVAYTKPAADQGTSVGLMLIMIGGALALVGSAVALINLFARPRMPHQTDDLWSRAQHDHDAIEPGPPLAHIEDDPSMAWDGPPMNWVRIAREEADRRDEEIQQLLSRPVRPAV